MAVQRVTGLEAQAVARAEAGEFEPVRRARREQRFGEARGIARRVVKFETVLTRVARAADQAGHPRHRALGEMVVLDEVERDGGQRLHDAGGLRPLHGQLRVVGGPVGEGGVEPRRLFAHPCKILVDVAGVDAEEKILRPAHVDQQVVHHAARRVAHRRVEHAAGKQAGDVIRHEVIEKAGGLGAAHVDLAHVADVEEAGGAAHGLVLLEDAAVLHRHLPAGEIHHARPMGHVKIAQGRALEVAHPKKPKRLPRGVPRIDSKMCGRR